jgi:hypothetical protein
MRFKRRTEHGLENATVNYGSSGVHAGCTFEGYTFKFFKSSYQLYLHITHVGDGFNLKGHYRNIREPKETAASTSGHKHWRYLGSGGRIAVYYTTLCLCQGVVLGCTLHMLQQHEFHEIVTKRHEHYQNNLLHNYPIEPDKVILSAHPPHAHRAAHTVRPCPCLRFHIHGDHARARAARAGSIQTADPCPP